LKLGWITIPVESFLYRNVGNSIDLISYIRPYYRVTWLKKRKKRLSLMFVYVVVKMKSKSSCKIIFCIHIYNHLEKKRRATPLFLPMYRTPSRPNVVLFYSPYRL